MLHPCECVDKGDGSDCTTEIEVSRNGEENGKFRWRCDRTLVGINDSDNKISKI